MNAMFWVCYFLFKINELESKVKRKNNFLSIQLVRGKKWTTVSSAEYNNKNVQFRNEAHQFWAIKNPASIKTLVSSS